MENKVIYIIAGEPSGDLLGARLMKALKEREGDNVRFIGIGGENMEAEGLNSLFPMKELSIMGLAEILPHIPKLLRRIRETVDDIKKQQPDCLITVDAPGFNFRVAKKLKNSAIPLIHYVAPTVWAWKPKRAKKIAAFLDHLMVLLPFEPPYFEKEGLPTTFVGHSVIESPVLKYDGESFRHRHGIPSHVPILCALPGSRKSEVSQLLPTFKESLFNIREQFPGLRVVMPTVDTVAQTVYDETATWSVPVLVVQGEMEKFGAFNAAHVALAASGTVSLELAMANTPSVITYRLKKLTYALVRRLIKVKYASLVNILHNRLIVPELLQDNCTSEKITQEVCSLLEHRDLRQKQQDELESALIMLGKNDELRPSQRAAQCVLEIIKEKKNV